MIVQSVVVKQKFVNAQKVVWVIIKYFYSCTVNITNGDIEGVGGWMRLKIYKVGFLGAKRAKSEKIILYPQKKLKNLWKMLDIKNAVCDNFINENKDMLI